MRFSFLLVSFVMLALSGCGSINLFSSSQASVGVHTVFRTQAGCQTLVAQTLDSGFLVATVPAGDVPEVQAVLQGPVREGRSVYALYPPGSVSAGSPTATVAPEGNVSLDVQALSLSLAEAVARYNTACG